jgi:beta-glucosidase
MGIRRVGDVGLVRDVFDRSLGKCGLDLEMPGPAAHRGPALEKAVKDGLVDEDTVNQCVLKVLRLVERSRKFQHPEESPDFSNPNPNKALLRKSAAEGMVLLKNEESILPLKKTTKVALIGGAATNPVINSGGSASYKVSPLEAFCRHFDDCTFSHGIPTFRRLPELPLHLTKTKSGKPGIDLEYINGKDPNAKFIHTDPVLRTSSPSFSQILCEHTIPELEEIFTLRMTTTFKPDTSGNHTLSLITTGDSDLEINGKHVYSHRLHSSITYSDILFDSPAFKQLIEFPMEANTQYEICLTAHSNNFPCGEQFPSQFFRLGFYPGYDFNELISSAVDVASDADVAVVFAGTNGEWETEGWDRPHMDVPFRGSPKRTHHSGCKSQAYDCRSPQRRTSRCVPVD